MIGNSQFDDALSPAIEYYLEQTSKLIETVATQPNSKELLAVQLAPDTFDTGFHLAVAIQFAARALCLPAGHPVPEIVEPYSLSSLRKLYQDVSEALSSAPSFDWNSEVTHVAGKAKLKQSAADYVIRFAFPNMLFHLSQAYAGLRHAGLNIGKADFDGQHEY